MTYEDRTHHGIQDGPQTGTSDDEPWQPARILIQKPEFGPTQRQQGVTVLREPAEPENSSFGWGCNGGGTNAVAAAILADALGPGDPDTCGIRYAAYPEDEVLAQLREDFCDDVLSPLCDQWRLRRGVILCWPRAGHLQGGIEELPAALRKHPLLQGQG